MAHYRPDPQGGDKRGAKASVGRYAASDPAGDRKPPDRVIGFIGLLSQGVLPERLHNPRRPVRAIVDSGEPRLAARLVLGSARRCLAGLARSDLDSGLASLAVRMGL